MGVEQAGKRVVDQKEVFALAQGGEWVEPLEFGIDETGVAHHDAAVRKLANKPGKNLGILRILRNPYVPAKAGFILTPCRLARRRKPLLNTSSAIAFGSPRRLCSGPIRPHCRTQTLGATSLTTLSNASRTCGNRCTC